METAKAGAAMKEQLEKECTALRAELAALRQRLDALETIRTNSQGRLIQTFAGLRLFKRVVVAVLPLVALVAVGSTLYGESPLQAFFIDPNGSVGIGTNTPRATLDVAGTLNVTKNADLGNTRISGSDAAAAQALILLNSNNANAKDEGVYQSYVVGTTGNEMARIQAANKAAGGLGAGYLSFYTRNNDKVTEKVRVDSNGNVGIGTTTPQGFQVVVPENSRPAELNPGITLAGGAEGNAGIKLRNNGQGTPYIDFSQQRGVDYDARIRLIAPGKLAIEGAKLVIGRTDLPVPVGAESLRILRGVVGFRGDMLSGAGFTVQKVKTGVFDIIFSQPFSKLPAASVTEIFGSYNIEKGAPYEGGVEGGSTLDYAVITHLSADRMRVKIGKSNGDAADRDFTFIVMGEL
jgi:hypothetical protein